MSIARVHQHSAALDPVYLAVCSRLFKPGQPPCSDELTRRSALLTARSNGHVEHHSEKGDRKHLLHVCPLRYSVYSDFSEAISIEKRYFTSDFNSRSYASLTF